MIRAGMVLVCAIAILAVSVGLTIWFQVDWSAAHEDAAPGMAATLSDWRPIVGYVLGAIGVFVLFQGAYALMRARHTSNYGKINRLIDDVLDRPAPPRDPSSD